MLVLFVDESEQGRFLGVGGYFTQLGALLDLERGWRQMKARVGLGEDDEIKWTLPVDHPTRNKLTGLNRTTKELHEEAITYIAANDLTIVVVVMVEQRKKPWYGALLRKRLTPRDFYCEGLRYVLQRMGEEALLNPQPSNGSKLPLLCVVDRPGLPKEPRGRVRSMLASTTIRLGEKAALDGYQVGFFQGPGEGPARRGNVPLKNLDFHSGLLMSGGSHSDALQIADVIVGCATSWVADTDVGRASSWLVDCMKQIVPRFRGGAINMFRDGFVIWPWENQLWGALQTSLR